MPWKIGGWLRILACQTVCEACGVSFPLLQRVRKLILTIFRPSTPAVLVILRGMCGRSTRKSSPPIACQTKASLIILYRGATPDITANPKKRILWEGVTSEKPRLRTVNPSATRGRPDLALSKSGTRTAQHPLRSDKKRRAYGWQKRAKARYLAGLGKKARLV